MEYLKGRALSANSSIDRMLIGGMRMDHQYNALGNGLINADASVNDLEGKSLTRKDGTYVIRPDGFNKRAMEKAKEILPDASPEEQRALASQIMANYQKGISYAKAKENAVFLMAENNTNGKNEASPSADLLGQGIGVLETYGLYGTAALAAVEKVTARGVKLKHDELIKEGAVFREANPEKGITGGYYKDGRKIADAEGYLLKPDGERLTKGIVSRSIDKLDKVGDKLKSKISSSSKNQTVQESANQQHSPDNSSADNSLKDNHSNSPLNENDKPIIKENAANFKSPKARKELINNVARINTDLEYLDKKKDTLLMKYGEDSEIVKRTDKLYDEILNGRSSLKEFYNNASNMSDGKMINALGLDDGVIKDLDKTARNRAKELVKAQYATNSKHSLLFILKNIFKTLDIWYSFGKKVYNGLEGRAYRVL